jgi:hypothetical protein
MKGISFIFLHKEKNIKQELHLEPYISFSNLKRKLITNLRISYHNFLINKGRMLKDKTDCSCLVIEVMEDELPFLLHCKKMTLRINLFQALKDENVDL